MVGDYIMTAAEIAWALGGAYHSGDWWRCRCPVHQSHGATLALHDGDRALVVYCFAGCPPVKVLKKLRELGLFNGPPNPDRVQPATSNNQRAERNRARALRIWNDAKLAERAVLLGRYLRSRNITMPIPRTLRWARSCWHDLERASYSAMIAAVADVTGNMIAIQRTYLLPDCSGKAPLKHVRLSLGPVKGGAVRLAPAGPLLMIAEGVETALSAMQACALPAWAALSNVGIENLILPEAVHEVIILADNDTNGVGQRSARIAGQRWVREGRKVRIALPPAKGDFNDMLLTGARDAAA
jgi:putative DNA primase/helicase